MVQVQKMSDQRKIKFLENEKSPENDKKSEVQPEKTLEILAEEQKSKKLNNKFKEDMTSNYISSARTGNIKDDNGSSKYIKSETSNSIWENDKTVKLINDNKTKTIQEKEKIASNKREAEQKRMDEMIDKLKSTDQTKASSISPAGVFSGSNYKAPTNNMSIFDNKDFMRVSEKTEGEKVSEEVKKRNSQEDESWRSGGKSVTSTEIGKKFINNLFKDK